ncbi:MAG: sensor histidine kinase [Cyanophyceae cyanobacterium]
MNLRDLRQQTHQCWSQVKRTLFPAESADYLRWRHEFLHQQLSFGLWIGLICFLIATSHLLYKYIFKLEQIRSDLDTLYGQPWRAEDLRDITLISFFVTTALIVVCILMQRSRWGKRYPAIVFLIFASSLNGLVTQITSTFYGIPVKPSTIVFLVFAVLLPLRWPLHLLSQLLPITYFTVVSPLLRFTKNVNLSIIEDVYNLGAFVEIVWVCLICNVSICVYERLRRSEFESRRELKILLHALSHDLRNPVMGTALVTKHLLNQADNGSVKIDVPVLERLVQGSDRQLALINALVEAYHADSQGITLRCQPLQLSAVVDAVLADVEPRLTQNKVELHNAISPALPPVQADPTHLWRVFSNLVDNALKHNPPGIRLILEAEVLKDAHSLACQPSSMSLLRANRPQTVLPTLPTTSSLMMPMLLCRVQDNGIGIPREQRQRLFELYTRGQRARYMPGLGLGLYLCQQIVTAHGGEIGVISDSNSFTIFWFTLPLTTTSKLSSCSAN